MTKKFTDIENEKLNAINQTFILMQDFLRDRMLFIADIFYKLSEENIGIKINPEQIKMDKEMLLNRRILHNNNFSWSKDNINKFFILNKTFCKMYDFMKSEIQKLYNRFNAYAENREIEGFSIFTNIHYQNTQRINDILDKRTLQIINRCLTDMNEEWLNMSIFNKPIFGCQTEDISLTWNFERFSQFLSEKEK